MGNQKIRIIYSSLIKDLFSVNDLKWFSGITGLRNILEPKKFILTFN